MKRKKILFLSALFPWPLESGGHIRVYNLLKNLGGSHDITLFAYIRSEAERAFIPKVSHFCRSVSVFLRGRGWQPKYFLRAATSSYPLLLASYDVQSVAQAVGRELSSGYDIIHCEPFYVGHIVPKNAPQKLIIVEHNIEYTLYEAVAKRSWYLPIVAPLMRLDHMKMRRQEEHMWARADRIICVSPEDQNIIERDSGRRDIALIPNGVDILHFPYKPRLIDPQSPRFLFTGNFSWFPNVSAYRMLISDVWPLLKKARPGSILRIVGSNLPERLRKVGEKRGVDVVGRVPDIRTEYDRADVILAPITIGGGSRFKILEAMASGIPVVTTPVGVAGLKIRESDVVLLADNPVEFAAQVNRLIQTDALRRTMTDAARKHVERYFDWRSIARELSHVWENV